MPLDLIPDSNRLAFGVYLFPLCLLKEAALEPMRGIYDSVPSLEQSMYDLRLIHTQELVNRATSGSTRL